MVTQVRARAQELLDKVFVEQVARLEWMWLKILLPRLERMESPEEPFDKDLFLASLKVMERIAKLTGADSGTKDDSWLSRPVTVEAQEALAIKYALNLHGAKLKPEAIDAE